MKDVDIGNKFEEIHKHGVNSDSNSYFRFQSAGSGIHFLKNCRVTLEIQEAFMSNTSEVL